MEKPDWWIEKPIMNAQQLAEFAQRLYDKDNWSGLNIEEHNKLIIVKRLYKEKTGNDLLLTYNCPA
jgi:hypothetical protein